MNRRLWRNTALVMTGLLMSSAAKAAAEPTEERVLVVGVSKGRGSEAGLVRGLGEHLQQTGMLLAADALSAQDRACESPDCIEELAQRQGAQLVLTAKLQENAPSSIFITMALFDTVRRAPFQETALCDQCNQDALLGKLSDVADKLIKQCREARQVPVRPQRLRQVPSVTMAALGAGSGGLSVASGVSPSPSEKGFHLSLSPTRKTVAGILGGVGLASLVTAIALSATNGQRTALGCTLNPKLPNDYCELRNEPLLGTGYALTGGVAIAVALTLFWPDNSAKTSSVEVH